MPGTLRGIAGFSRYGRRALPAGNGAGARPGLFYSRTVFEFQRPGAGAQNTLAAGGAL